MKNAICALALVVCTSSLIDAQSRTGSGNYQRKWPSNPTSTPSPTPSPTPTPTPSSSVADQIAADMIGQSEGQPAGWLWGTDPAIEMGNNPAGNGAAVQWGVIYVSSSGSSATNTRVAIRACEIYWLQRSTQSWILGAKSNAPQIELYAGDYSWGPASVSSRTENDGSTSVVPVYGDVLHFYPDRFGILPNDLAGWAGVCQMRLVPDNPSRPDDRANAHFLASTGADYYPSLSGPGIAYNPGIAAGKQKFVTNDWRSFAMTTLPQAQLESNPPPFDLGGVLP
ncbi:MAG: hypothetical protein ACJ74Y_10005 [Bryobacteraceae bacterium]